MDERIQKHVEKTLEMERKAEIPGGGMGAYDPWRFDKYRKYYKRLRSADKRDYEDAVLAICGLPNPKDARLGLYLCSQLADLFPANWRSRVEAVVGSFVKAGLPLHVEGTNTLDVLELIAELQLSSFVPFERDYLHQVSQAFKSGAMDPVQWANLRYGLSQGLISMAPAAFWEEFHLLVRDRRSLEVWGDDLAHGIRSWALDGGRSYGFAWLKQLATECSKLADPQIRALAGAALREQAEDWLTFSAENRGYAWPRDTTEQELRDYLGWLKEQPPERQSR